MAQIGALECSSETVIYPQLCMKGSSSDALCPLPAMSRPKPRPPLSPNELLHYSEEHKKSIVELAEAVRDLLPYSAKWLF
jgi:hypothetical protein